MSQGQPSELFTSFEDRVLTHPKSDPVALVKNLQSTCKTMSSPRAVAAAHVCLAQQSWAHLSLMSKAGFDLSANYYRDVENQDIRIKETLLHRAVRTSPYDRLASIVERMIEIGCNPKAFNAQGASVLGVLCSRAIDMPPHRVKEVFHALALGGVRMSDPIINEKSVSKWLFHTKSAPDYLRLSDPKTANWAQALADLEALEGNTPSVAGFISKPPRL